MTTTVLEIEQVGDGTATLVTKGSATFTALNDTFGEQLNLDPFQAVSVQVSGTFVGTVGFEVSNDKVNWTTKNLISSAGNTGATSTTPGVWAGDIGARYFRARVSAFTSGAPRVDIYGVIESMSYGPVSQTITSAFLTTGATALGKAEDTTHATADVGVATFGVRVPAAPAAQTSAVGDYGTFAIDAEGKQVMSGWGAAELSFSSNINLTTTSDVALRAAQAAGIRTFVTDLILENTGAASARVLVRDGTTQIFSATLAAGQTLDCNLRTPLRGTAATALNAQLGAAGTVTVTTLGFSGV